MSDEVYVPGVARCPKCEFRLVKTVLSAVDGSAGAGEVVGEKCPNCDVPLWRVSWKDEAQEYAAICDQQIERAEKFQKDASRYRWLRGRDLETIDKGGVFAGKTPENVVLNGEDLDRAVDAAMEAEDG